MTETPSPRLTPTDDGVSPLPWSRHMAALIMELTSAAIGPDTARNKRLVELMHAAFDRTDSVATTSLQHAPHDYVNAPSGIGPLAAEWKDKPHRLIYDLAIEVIRLSAAIKEQPHEPHPSA